MSFPPRGMRISGDPRPLAIVLTTTTRMEYLADTILSLNAAGADERLRRVILAQGPAGRLFEMGGPIDGWEAYSTSSRLEGVVDATITALAIADLCTAPYLLLFEDDLEAGFHAVDVMMSAPVPDDLNYLSFFDSRWLDVYNDCDDNNRLLELRPLEGGPTHFGNLALKFPRSTIAALCDCLDDFTPTSRNEMDIQLPTLFRTLNRGRYGLYCPSLVQHIGERSGITPAQQKLEGYGRTALNFALDTEDCRPEPPRELCLTTRPGKG